MPVAKKPNTDAVAMIDRERLKDIQRDALKAAPRVMHLLEFPKDISCQLDRLEIHRHLLLEMIDVFDSVQKDKSSEISNSS